MPMAATRKASGIARPTKDTAPCGLMLAAMLGAISPTESPIAAQIVSLPMRRDWPASVPLPTVFVDMIAIPPLADGASSA